MYGQCRFAPPTRRGKPPSALKALNRLHAYRAVPRMGDFQGGAGIRCAPELPGSRCNFPSPFEACRVTARHRSRSGDRRFGGGLWDGLMSFFVGVLQSDSVARHGAAVWLVTVGLGRIGQRSPSRSSDECLRCTRSVLTAVRGFDPTAVTLLAGSRRSASKLPTNVAAGRRAWFVSVSDF